MNGPLVIQVYGPKPWESNKLTEEIHNLIAHGLGDEICKYIRYAHEDGGEHTIEEITINEVLDRIYEGRDIS